MQICPECACESVSEPVSKCQTFASATHTSTALSNEFRYTFIDISITAFSFLSVTEKHAEISVFALTRTNKQNHSIYLSLSVLLTL